MKKFLLICCLAFIGFSALSQNDNSSKEKERKFNLSLDGGFQLMQFEVNGDFLQNRMAYIRDFQAKYYIADEYYFATGFNFADKVALIGVNFDTYQIPLIFGFDFDKVQPKKGSFNAFGELGIYLRGINDFNNFTDQNFTTKEVIGLQASFGTQYNISQRMFTRLKLRSSNDFNEILQDPNTNLEISGSYSFMLGFGYRF